MIIICEFHTLYKCTFYIAYYSQLYAKQIIKKNIIKCNINIYNRKNKNAIPEITVSPRFKWRVTIYLRNEKIVVKNPDLKDYNLKIN